MVPITAKTRKLALAWIRDIVPLKCGEKKLACVVTSKCKYSSFGEMLNKEGLQNCLPSTLRDGILKYYSFNGYKEQERELGVIEFGISPK